MVWWHEVNNAVCDSMGFCRYFSVFSSPRGLGYDQFSKLIALRNGTRIYAKQLKTAGERIYTLERMMLVKDGMSSRDDTLPRRYFDEPIPDGPSKGEIIVQEEFDRMLDEYDDLHGWDENGIPTPKTLKRLGLGT